MRKMRPRDGETTKQPISGRAPTRTMLLSLLAEHFPHSTRADKPVFQTSPESVGWRLLTTSHLQEHRAGPLRSPGLGSFLNQDALRAHCRPHHQLHPPPSWAQLGPCTGSGETLGSISSQLGSRNSSRRWPLAPSELYCRHLGLPQQPQAPCSSSPASLRTQAAAWSQAVHGSPILCPPRDRSNDH